MHILLNRRDVGYTAISRFEEAFRQFLAENLHSHFGNYIDGIPRGVVEKAQERMSGGQWDDASDFLSDVDFPDLKEISCFKNGYTSFFPVTNIDQRDFESLMDDLYQRRCQIAHVKRHFSAFDMDKLLETSQRIASQLGDYGQEYIQFISILRENPAAVTVSMPPSFSEDGPDLFDVPNNIPVPDYEYEGGFVGRTEDIRAIIKLLKGNRNVVTISGAGGVGKTALALRVIQVMLQEPQHGFDGVIWLSAKETKLSYLGIEDVEPTLKNYEELLDTIFSVMGFGKPSTSLEMREADVATVFSLYPRLLLVIDNLETITDDRITNFILDIEDTFPQAKMLITSRRGLGQVERRYELQQLKVKEAINLFRRIAKDKNLESLARTDDELIEKYVKKVACYPLAVKWVIGQVAIGKDINNVIDEINETTSEISRFSFEQVYHSLSPSAHKIICALSTMDELPSTGLLNYLVDMDKETFEDSLHELILVSLVTPEPYKDAQNQLSTHYTLLSLTRGYVRQQLDNLPDLKRTLIERLGNVRSTIEEAERARKQYRYGLTDLGAITEDEKVAAMIVQSAFQKYQAGRYADAVELYKKARNVAPRFASLYRNWAVMEYQEQHFVEANELMKKASELNPNDSQIWLIWGNIKRKEGKINDALSMYEKAHEIAPNDAYALNAFGQAKARAGRHKEADELFKLALTQNSNNYSIQAEIVNLTSIARNLIRWAETDQQKGNVESAEQRLNEALTHCEAVIQLDATDYRSQQVFRKVVRNLAYLHRQDHPLIALKLFERTIVHKPVKSMSYAEAKDTIEAAIQASKILVRLGKIEEARKIFPQYLREIRKPLQENQRLREEFQVLWKSLYGQTVPDSSHKKDSSVEKQTEAPRIRGIVKFFNNRSGYGFILADQGGEIFVHYSEIIDKGFRCLAEGQRVEFKVLITDKGPQAQEVLVINGS